MSDLPIVNVIVGRGNKVHRAYTWLDERDKSKPPVIRVWKTVCGADICTTGSRRIKASLRQTSLPANCERCLRITEGKDAAF